MEVLGIGVSDELVERWRNWLAPALQPFWVTSVAGWPGVEGPGRIQSEAQDTYATWRLDAGLKVLWMDEATFFDLPRARRAELVRAQVDHRRGAVPSVRRWSGLLDARVLRTQADGHRFVWWPSLVTGTPGVLSRVMARSPTGAGPASLPSRHAEVSTSTCAEEPGLRRGQAARAQSPASDVRTRVVVRDRRIGRAGGS